MRVCILSSGSKGNCTYIESNNSKILLDIGVNLKYVLECLNKLGVEPTEIKAVLITHEHSDHIKGVENFCKKFDAPIFCLPSLYNVLCAQMPSCINLINTFNANFEIDDLKIYPFELSHDSISCCGYRISDETGTVGFATDTGVLPDNAFKLLTGCQLVFLESNYDKEMLLACPYPIFLKKRIMSNRGHLSNLDCAKIIEKLSNTGTRLVVLSHLSENSNTPYLAYNTVKNYLEEHNIYIGKNINIGINYQNKLNTIYKLNSKK